MNQSAGVELGDEDLEKACTVWNKLEANFLYICRVPQLKKEFILFNSISVNLHSNIIKDLLTESYHSLEPGRRTDRVRTGGQFQVKNEVLEQGRLPHQLLTIHQRWIETHGCDDVHEDPHEGL